MKKQLTLLLLLLAGLAATARAAAPLLPFRLTLAEGLCEPGSQIYLKMAIHAGDTNGFLWSSSEPGEDGEPLLGFPCRLQGQAVSLLIGNAAIPGMAPLPEDLFAGHDRLALRIWFSQEQGGLYSRLTEDLDIVPAPYALAAGGAAGLTELQEDLEQVRSSLGSLESTSAALAEGALDIPTVSSRILSGLFLEQDGSVTIRTASQARCANGTSAVPVLRSVSSGTVVASRIESPGLDSLKSVTLYFGSPEEIAPPEAVTLYADSSFKSLIASATAVNTSDFPRCSYDLRVPLEPDKSYLLGLTPTKKYPKVYPYLAPNYRCGQTSSAPAASTLIRWIPLSYDQELWSQIRLGSDTDLPLLSSADSITMDMLSTRLRRALITTWGGSVTGTLYVSDLRLPELGSLGELLAQLRSESVLTSAGGSVTGALYVSDLRLPGSGNWQVGSPEEPCDILLANTNSCLRAAGPLVLAAGGEILPASFVNFGPDQGGRVGVPKGETAAVFARGLDIDAVVSVTPLQKVPCAYWAELVDGQAAVRLESPCGQVLEFNYVIIRK